MNITKKKILNIIKEKSFQAGNLPEKYDEYEGGDDYASLMDVEDVFRILKAIGIEFTEKEKETGD